MKVTGDAGSLRLRASASRISETGFSAVYSAVHFRSPPGLAGDSDEEEEGPRTDGDGEEAQVGEEERAEEDAWSTLEADGAAQGELYAVLDSLKVGVGTPGDC